MSEERPGRIRQTDLEEAEADAADLGQFVHRWLHLAEQALAGDGADSRTVLTQLRDEMHAALVWIDDDPRKLSEQGRAAALAGAEVLVREAAAKAEEGSR